MLKALMYIIEECSDLEVFLNLPVDEMSGHLRRAGVPEPEVDQVLHWFDGLWNYEADNSVLGIGAQDAMRFYSPEECDVLDEHCRGFILSLEHKGILDPYARELLIDRLMSLKTNQCLTPLDVQWVGLLVLYHLPNRKEELTALQHIVMFGDQGRLQ